MTSPFFPSSQRYRIAGPRYLVVNADDFGYRDPITLGILRAWQAGVVTSTLRDFRVGDFDGTVEDAYAAGRVAELNRVKE